MENKLMSPLLFQILSAVSFSLLLRVKFLVDTITILGYSLTITCSLVIFRSNHRIYIVQTQVIIADLQRLAHFKIFPSSSGML